MYSSTNQTPISILQEVSIKRHLHISYELVANEGQPHEPVYVYQCSAGKFSAIGKGVSKKRAKHLASYYVLLGILGDNPTAQADKTLLANLHSSAASLLGIEYPLDGESMNTEKSVVPRPPTNYVSMLQEHCDKNMWPPPSYEFADCPASIYGGKFQCKVRLWRWEYSGFGASKKEAKRKAASECLRDVLEQGLTIPADALEAMEEENLPLVEKKDLETLKDRQTIDEKASKAAKKILSGVFTNQGKLREIVLDALWTKDVYGSLQYILDQKKMTVFYSYINTTNSGKIYCQAQLSTLPPQVVTSRAFDSIDEARRDAASRCLVYLQTMTRPAPSLDQSDWFRIPPV